MGACTVVTTEDKGRGLVTSGDVGEGAELLSEGPLLLTVASEAVREVCAECLRRLPAPGHLQCTDTQQACFCCEACAAAAECTPGSLSAAIRRSLAQVPWDALSADEQHHVRLCLQAYSLKAAAAKGHADAQARMQAIEDLVAPSTQANEGTAASLHRVREALAAACGGAAPLHEVEMQQLINIDAANGYGIMAPPGPNGERRIRGSGLYANASLVNHECLPNVARVDNFDSDDANRTHISLRALHALPRGTEILASYVPLHWELETRQRQCREVYGFACKCPRCKCEQAEAALQDPLNTAQPLGPDATAYRQDDEEREIADPGYVQVFLLKYVCTEEGCFGTFVPRESSEEKLMQCNMCSHARTEADFLRDLQAGMGDEDEDD